MGRRQSHPIVLFFVWQTCVVEDVLMWAKMVQTKCTMVSGECLETLDTGEHADAPEADPKLLPILQFPDVRLSVKSKPVEVVDARIKKLIDDMAYAMYKDGATGIAAVQVGVPERIIVMDMSGNWQGLTKA